MAEKQTERETKKVNGVKPPPHIPLHPLVTTPPLCHYSPTTTTTIIPPSPQPQLSPFTSPAPPSPPQTVTTTTTIPHSLLPNPRLGCLKSYVCRGLTNSISTTPRRLALGASQRCLLGRWKPDMLRSGVVPMRRFMVIRLRPCVITSTPPTPRPAPTTSTGLHPPLLVVPKRLFPQVPRHH